MNFIPCEKCKNTDDRLPEGYYWADKEKTMATECECHYKWRIEEQSRKLFKHYGFNEKYWNYNPRSYVGTKSVNDKNRLLNYIVQFKENPDVRKLLVYMYGPNGTQKTSLANYVGKRLILDGFDIRYVLMNNLVNDLQDMEFHEDLKKKIERLNDADLLIVDEAFDKEKMTLYKSGYQKSFLDSWMRDRIQSKNKGILFISNVKPENIADQGLSISIQDFVQRECIINKTLLTFEDNYIAESHIEFDSSKGLF